MKNSGATKYKEPRKNLIITDADIFDVKAEVLVNSANREPKYGAAKNYKSLDFLVFQYAGKEELLKERLEKKALKAGQCVMTDSYKLSERGFKYIAHVNVPSFDSNEKAVYHTYYKLEEAIYNTLCQVRNKGCKSVVFPVLGTGAKGFEEDDAFFCMLDAIHKFFFYNEDYFLTVYLSIRSRELYETARTMCREEYFEPNISAMNIDAELNDALEKKPKGFANEEVVLRRMMNFETRRNRVQGPPFFKAEKLRLLFEAKDRKEIQEKSDTDRQLKPTTFASKVHDMWKATGLTKQKLAEKSFITVEQLNYILEGGTKYDRSTVFGLCYGFKLNYTQSLYFLQSAGMCFKIWDYAECIIMYGIENGLSAERVRNVLKDLEWIEDKKRKGNDSKNEKPKEIKMTNLKEKVMKQKASYIGERKCLK